MILRKPYAFLIKNFKLIHLVLTVLLGFILYKTNNLLGFFNEYLQNKKYEVIDNLVNDYIGIYPYIAIFLTIGISLVIFLLMRKKDKPIKYYLILIIYYVLLIADLAFSSIQLNNIAFNKIDVLMLNITRDILLVLYLFQIPLLIISIVRTVGFNIKKFNFQRDLMELKVDEEDNEEFELDVDIDSFDVKTRFRRRKRLFGYILKENKLIIMILIGITLIIGGVVVNNTIYKDKIVYKENKTFTSNGIEMAVIDSYNFESDMFGNDISKDKYNYIVARVKVKNKSEEIRKINMNTFTLKVNNVNIYEARTKEKDYFIPLGTIRESISLDKNEEDIVIVIFRINKDDLKGNKIMEYAGSYKVKDNERIYNIDKVKLVPRSYDELKKVKTEKLGNTLTFEDSILKETSISINSFEIKNRYTYSYEQCTDKCYTFNDFIVPVINTKYNMSVMRLDININVDKSLKNDSLKEKLIPSLAHIRYVINEKEYVQKFNIYDITPSKVNDYKYYEVKGEIEKADRVYLDFIILDKIYTYVLKEA